MRPSYKTSDRCKPPSAARGKLNAAGASNVLRRRRHSLMHLITSPIGRRHPRSCSLRPTSSPVCALGAGLPRCDHYAVSSEFQTIIQTHPDVTGLQNVIRGGQTLVFIEMSPLCCRCHSTWRGTRCGCDIFVCHFNDTDHCCCCCCCTSKGHSEVALD